MSIDFSDDRLPNDNLMTTSAISEDDGEFSLRPQTLSEYIGQDKAKSNLAVFIEDRTLQQVARFVSERISTFDGVLSTATHFILKKYKSEGALTEKEDVDYRISIQA